MIGKIYVMGDIHGSFKPIRDFHLRHINEKEYCKANKTIILLGDSGLNYFFNDRDEGFKKKLKKYPFTYFVIRGNHEERPSICAEKYPDKWHKEQFWGGWVWVENNYPYIKYAMDYVAMYNIPFGVDYFSPENYWEDDIEVILTYKTLVIPGAYSVDKYKRLHEGWSWFPREQLSLDEMVDGIEMLIDEEWKCDLVLSHTCPIMYEPTDLFLSVVDQSMVDKTMERYLDHIEYNLDYKLWCFGHYHDTRIYPKNEDKQMLMLFNNKVIELSEWMDGFIGQWY